MVCSGAANQAALEKFVNESIVDLLQPEILSQEEGRIEILYGVRPELTIGSGVVQGGIVASMLDMAMAFSENGNISTASLHVDILRPVTGEKLKVVGQVTRRGRRIVFIEAEMTNDEGQIVARGRQTAVPLSKPPVVLEVNP